MLQVLPLKTWKELLPIILRYEERFGQNSEMNGLYVDDRTKERNGRKEQWKEKERRKEKGRRKGKKGKGKRKEKKDKIGLDRTRQEKKRLTGKRATKAYFMSKA